MGCLEHNAHSDLQQCMRSVPEPWPGYACIECAYQLQKRLLDCISRHGCIAADSCNTTTVFTSKLSHAHGHDAQPTVDSLKSPQVRKDNLSNCMLEPVK